ncbi:hypothetical protein VP01_569g4 [Puccinia sorghi]|uniref:Uncharacterized protein n=1 Tax=Puccinia sorghi TaxID=27349 RepID=A0A0L6UIN9_9BASI|nr:hypothetical protein VP01_569g4 [Puccinia sorghi]
MELGGRLPILTLATSWELFDQILGVVFPRPILYWISLWFYNHFSLLFFYAVLTGLDMIMFKENTYHPLQVIHTGLIQPTFNTLPFPNLTYWNTSVMALAMQVPKWSPDFSKIFMKSLLYDREYNHQTYPNLFYVSLSQVLTIPFSHTPKLQISLDLLHALNQSFKREGISLSNVTIYIIMYLLYISSCIYYIYHHVFMEIGSKIIYHWIISFLLHFFREFHFPLILFVSKMLGGIKNWNNKTIFAGGRYQEAINIHSQIKNEWVQLRFTLWVYRTPVAGVYFPCLQNTVAQDASPQNKLLCATALILETLRLPTPLNSAQLYILTNRMKLIKYISFQNYSLKIVGNLCGSELQIECCSIW